MIIAAIVAVFLVLFIVWRVRFGYPRSDMPAVLCYHKLSERFCLEGTWMTPRRFLGHIDHLSAEGFRFISETEFLAALENPHRGHARTILLTFDDGYEALYEMYMRELLPRNIPVLVFLPSDHMGVVNSWDLSLGRRPFRHLSWEQVADMARSGAQFGSHGAAHADLTRVGRSELSREVVESKSAIEQATGQAVRSFSYPFGRYNARVRAAVAGAGYDAAFSLYPSHSNQRTDRFALRRNGVYIIDGWYALRCKLRPGPFFWFEEMKCRAINAIAVLTPLVKRLSAGPGK
jgi:peptidoglycan/xylan/chitin deacetylase (PgdA/CDA1 family)